MDTGTHIVMGAALAGLSMADPVIVAEPATMIAVFAGVVIGSLIPDVDTILKLRNNAIYIRHHRGITHSIPAVLIWPILISVLLSFVSTWCELFSFMGLDISCSVPSCFRRHL